MSVWSRTSRRSPPVFEMTRSGAHLVERAAERLREASGLRGPEIGPGEDQDARRHSRPAAEADARDPDLSRRVRPDSVSEATERLQLSAPSVPADDQTLPRRPMIEVSGGRTGREEELPALVRSRGQLAPAPSDDESAPSGPVIDMAALESAGLVVGRAGRTRAADEFRITVGHVLRSIRSTYTAGHAAANVVLVTSSRPR